MNILNSIPHQSYPPSRVTPSVTPPISHTLHFQRAIGAIPPVHYSYQGYYRSGVDNCVAFTFRNLLELEDKRKTVKGNDQNAEDASRALYFMLTLVDCIGKGTAKINIPALDKFSQTVPASNTQFHLLVRALKNPSNTQYSDAQYRVETLLRASGSGKTSQVKLARTAYMLFLSQITDSDCVDLHALSAKDKLLQAFRRNEPVLISEAGGPQNDRRPLFSRLTNSQVRGGHLYLVYPMQGQIYLTDPNLPNPMPIHFEDFEKRIHGQLNIYDEPTNRAYIIHRRPQIPDWLRTETDRRWPPVNAFAKALLDNPS